MNIWKKHYNLLRDKPHFIKKGFNIAKAASCLEDAMQSEGFTFKHCVSGDSNDEIARICREVC